VWNTLSAGPPEARRDSGRLSSRIAAFDREEHEPSPDGRLLKKSRWQVPDAPAIPVHLADTVKRNTPHLAGFVQYLKNAALACREADLLEGDLVNGALPAVEIADLELAPAKLPVVADAAQQFVDRLYGGDSGAGRASAQAWRLPPGRMETAVA